MNDRGHAFSRRAKFVLERWVQRGILHQLLLMAGLIAAVAMLGGIAGWGLTPAFESLPAAVWWSFLRLTDPGYLGDDEGVLLRVVSTVVTVLGYVLFMGSMIAIMTQWLASTIRKLESGLTPIAMEGHFVILGWTNRTAEIIQKLLSAGGRLERFFAARSGTRKLRVVVLADKVDAGRRLELRESLGSDWNERQIFLRSGSSLQKEHLERLDLPRAAVVIIPGADFQIGGSELTDTRVVKTLLSLDAVLQQNGGGRTPTVVVELLDPRKVPLACNSVEAQVQVVAGERLIGRLLSQSLRHPGVAKVLLMLLTHREGNALYLRGFPQLAGSSLRELIDRFPAAIVLGVVSMDDGSPIVQLDPTRDVVLQENDRLVLLAASYDQCQVVGGAHDPQPRTRTLTSSPEPERRKLLILGWSDKIPAFLMELLESKVGRFEVTILSKVNAGERGRALAGVEGSDRLTVHNPEGDYSLEPDLDRVEPHRFDHVIFLASSRMQSSEQADARTVLGLLLLRSRLRQHDSTPEILVELLDPDNESLLSGAGEIVFVSPRMLSHLLAHVGLLPELNAVFDSLICSGGSEIELRPIADIGLEVNDVTFAEIQHAAARSGCVGLGLYCAQEPGASHQVHLNPDRDRRWALGAKDRVILLSATTA